MLSAVECEVVVVVASEDGSGTEGERLCLGSTWQARSATACPLTQPRHRHTPSRPASPRALKAFRIKLEAIEQYYGGDTPSKAPDGGSRCRTIRDSRCSAREVQADCGILVYVYLKTRDGSALIWPRRILHPADHTESTTTHHRRGVHELCPTADGQAGGLQARECCE